MGGRNPQSGFTLTEILISIGLLGLLASALLSTANTQVQLHRDQNRTQGAQDNARAALDVLAHDARLIGSPTRGYGMVNSTMSGPATVPIYRVIDNFYQGADRLEVVVPAGEMLMTATDTPAATQNVEVARFDPLSQVNPGGSPAPTIGITAGDHLILTNLTAVAVPRPPTFLSAASACAGPGAIGASLLEVQTVSSSTSLIVSPISTSGCSFPRGSLVVRANATAYYIDDSFQLVSERGGPMRFTPMPLGTSAPLAEGIADLQIAVGVDGLNGNPVDGVLREVGAGPNDDEWAFNVSGELLPVQPPSAIRITIIARTLTQDSQNGPGRPRVEDHDAGAPDGFRYRVLSTTVVPRNLVSQ